MRLQLDGRRIDARVIHDCRARRDVLRLRVDGAEIDMAFSHPDDIRGHAHEILEAVTSYEDGERVHHTVWGPIPLDDEYTFI